MIQWSHIRNLIIICCSLSIKNENLQRKLQEKQSEDFVKRLLKPFPNSENFVENIIKILNDPKKFVERYVTTNDY